MYWQLQGADELGLNWGYIIDNKDYMLSHLNSIFCFKTSGVNNEQWQALGGDTKFMTPDAPISYSSHITCMAVGTQPGKREGNPKEGTTSAILKYTSRAVNEAAVDSEVPSYREEVEWKPQNSMTTAPLNVRVSRRPPPPPPHTHHRPTRPHPRLPRHHPQDIYCIKQKEENVWEDDSDIHCYAVGDGGVIRYTSNGGASPWRTLFSGVKENLRKVVIINEMHSQVAFGTGAGGSAQGQAVIIGDNGRVLFTGDGGNTWEKLPRVTPEHLVSIQFNPFDDFYYEPDGNPTGSPQTNEFSGGMHLPFGNGIATGSVLYNWAKTGEEALTDCLPDGAAPNVDGSAAGRFGDPVQYRCTKPEVATILPNRGGSLNLGQWRCSAECTGARRDAVVPVVLTDKRASDADWNAWFGTYPRATSARASRTLTGSRGRPRRRRGCARSSARATRCGRSATGGGGTRTRARRATTRQCRATKTASTT